MNKKILGAIGAALLAGVVVSGASCWRTMRFPESACTGGKHSVTGTFLPSYDYAELRETDWENKFQVIESAGTCESESCKAALGAATSKEGWSNASNGRMPGHRYLVAMKGDKALVVDERTSKIGAALAPIDSPQKAAIVASINRNLTFDCERAARKVDDGYEVHVYTTSCFGPRDEVIKVAVNGETTVISADSSRGTCVGQVLDSDWNARHIEPKYAAATPTK